jgi:hypothetical protein
MHAKAPLFGVLQIKMPRRTSHIRKGLWLAPPARLYKNPNAASPKQRAVWARFTEAARGKGVKLRERIAKVVAALKGFKA